MKDAHAAIIRRINLSRDCNNGLSNGILSYKKYFVDTKEDLLHKKYNVEERRICRLKELTEEIVTRLPTMYMVDKMPCLNLEIRVSSIFILCTFLSLFAFKE